MSRLDVVPAFVTKLDEGRLGTIAEEYDESYVFDFPSARRVVANRGILEDGRVDIELVTAPTADVRSLVGELEDDLAAGYPPEQRHGLPIDAIFQPHIRFFVARADGAAIGCAGVALFDGFAELKRMYVRPGHRGRGVAEALLARIETVTRDASLGRLCLETGTLQHAAMRFYSRVGFSVCGPFGAYVAMPAANIEASVFYEKRLVPNDR